MDKLKQFFGTQGNFVNESETDDGSRSATQDEERGFVAEALDASTLSWKTRVKGFIFCFSIGCFLSILSTIVLALGGNLVKFAVIYSMGNIISILSTCFLMGPFNQIKKMFAPTRMVASIVMLSALLLTLCSAFWWKKKGLTILFCILQYLAMTWYSISYIPYARDAIIKVVGSCLD